MTAPTDSQVHELVRSIGPETTRDQRLHTLDQLVLYWLGPCPENERYSETELGELEAPYPLKRLLSVLGRRRWPSNTLVNLTSLESLSVEDDNRITFATENQNVWELRTELFGKDPDVYTNMRDAETFEPLPEPLSEVLLEVVLAGFITTAAACRHAVPIAPDAMAALLQQFDPVGLTPFMAPIYPYEFFARPGVFAMVYQGDDTDHYEAIVGAKTLERLQLLEKGPDVGWYDW